MLQELKQNKRYNSKLEQNLGQKTKHEAGLKTFYTRSEIGGVLPHESTVHPRTLPSSIAIRFREPCSNLLKSRPHLSKDLLRPELYAKDAWFEDKRYDNQNRIGTRVLRIPSNE